MIPDSAAKKLAALQLAASDARALAEAARTQASVLEAKVLQLHNGAADAGTIAKAAEQHERASDLQQSRYRAWQQREELVTRLKAWLGELPRNVTLETVPLPAVDLNGQSPTTVIGTVRSEIARLAAEYHDIRTADAPLDDAKRQVRELVSALGHKGKPVIHTQFGELHVRGWSGAEQFGPTFHDATVAMLCWLMPDTVIARLDEALEAMPRNDDALPVAERAAKLAEIERQIFQLELQEETLISAAAKDGTVVARRPDQSPASVLEVQIVASAARAA
jgi:hypothetical protein